MCHRASGRCARTITHAPARTRPRARTRTTGDDAGFSLIEVIISLALSSLVVAGTLNAVIGSIQASTISRAAANVETSLVNAADRVNRAPKRCDYTIYAQAAVQTQGWAADTASVTQQYYVPGADPTLPGTWLVGPTGSPGCAGTTPTELLVQRVEIQITSPDGKVTRSIEVVKSDV